MPQILANSFLALNYVFSVQVWYIYTLRLTGTLLFSGLPLMIWQKKICKYFFYFADCSNPKNLWNDKSSKLHFAIWWKNASIEFCQWTEIWGQIFRWTWKSNAWMDLLEKTNLLYQFLFYFLQVKLFSP